MGRGRVTRPAEGATIQAARPLSRSLADGPGGRVGSVGVAAGVVAVVGRPNVGKSTLVNRLVGSREAVTDSRPGVTRDWRPVACEWVGRRFFLVDTGGWTASRRGLDAKVSASAAYAAGSADVILLVVDATVGVTGEDEEVASMVRKLGSPVIVVANKVDSERQEANLWELDRLGLGEAMAVSALHGRGTGDLLDATVALLGEPVAHPEEAGEPQVEEQVERVAIVGRPNAGKSTLFNRLVSSDRSIVHDEPGTTVDSIDTVVETPAGTLRFVDTAGLRRHARRAEGPEYYSLVRALASIDAADVCLLVIDATTGVTQQDQRIAERIDASGSPVVVVLNKWEMLDAEARALVLADCEDRLGFVSYAPILKVSALTGKGVHRLFPALSAAVDAYHRRIPTAELNRVVADAQAATPPPRGSRILYATQGAVDPPTITLFCNRPVARTYLRYLERRIREGFKLGPTPLTMRVRLRSGLR